MESTTLYIYHVNSLYAGEQNWFSNTVHKIDSLKALWISSEMSAIVVHPLPKVVV